MPFYYLLGKVHINSITSIHSESPFQTTEAQRSQGTYLRSHSKDWNLCMGITALTPHNSPGNWPPQVPHTPFRLFHTPESLTHTGYGVALVQGERKTLENLTRQEAGLLRAPALGFQGPKMLRKPQCLLGGDRRRPQSLSSIPMGSRSGPFPSPLLLP